MSETTAVDELVAEIGRTTNLDALLRLRRFVPIEVLESWRRLPGEEPEWDRILSEIERIGRAFDDRREELQAAAAAPPESGSASSQPAGAGSAAGSKRSRGSRGAK